MSRDLFPVTKNLIYLNHAALGPLSTRAYEAMDRHARDQRDFGALHWREWYAEYDHLRASAARLIGVEANEIAILKNTSEGLSFVAEGYRWQQGENVITTQLEFPSNYTPWKRLERRGVECRIAVLPTVEAIEPLMDRRTRIVTVSSVAFHNGFTADLEAIGALCARRGVLFCVDAIQSVGVLPIDVRKANVAFLAADGHKWMCGPESAAIFYVATAHGGLWKTTNAGTTFEAQFQDQGLISIGDATVSQSNPDLVWVGTGESNNRQSTSWGDGIYKSTNGGKTYANMGLRSSRHINRIVVDPRNNDTVFVAATGVTTGSLLRGVRYLPNGAVTDSIVMRSRSGTSRRIEATHLLDKLEALTGREYR